MRRVCRLIWTAVVCVLPLSVCAANASKARADSTGHFETQVAPLLARHCLECHDSSTKKGRLDLSRKQAAFAGGKKGKAIVPGRSSESRLWQMVESDEMPEERPPLSPAEKKALREWIDGGAVWPGDAIDPLGHLRDRRAVQNWIRRLTVPEYIETVRSAVGVDIGEDARRILPPDLRADGFNNTAYNLTVDLRHVEAYARLAEMIVRRLDVLHFAGQFSERRDLDDATMRELIASMGRWLLRGPLNEHEIASYRSISNAIAKDGGGYADAVRCILEAMLQSPRFVYRIEKQLESGMPRRVGDHELASRLSYMIWGGPPDKELLRAADAGELSDRERVAAQVHRMIQDPRAVRRSLRFVEEWLDLDRLQNLRPDKKRFPAWNAELAADMRAETLAFFEEIAWKQNRPLSHLLNAKVTFLSPRLARHYGLRREYAPAGTKNGGPLVLYRFNERKGAVIKNGVDSVPLDLRVETSSAIEWVDDGLKIKAPTLIVSADAPRQLINALIKSSSVTLEAWITPSDTKQNGPARIVSLSSGTSDRNFTLGQDGERFEVRFRTSKTDANGQPALSSPSGSAKARPMHVIYTRDTAGKARLYVDGNELASREVGGQLSNWSGSFKLALANETTHDRPWRGTLHLLAIYDRALTSEEITSHSGNLTRYDLASVPSRGGLLTQGSVLTVGGDEASMVERGLFVLNDLLYSGVGSPPPGVNTTPVPTKPGMSQRAVAEARLADQSCAGCHTKFEPLAFGLEKFDGVGAFHAKDEHGNKLRDDGHILFPGAEQPVPFKTSAELMDLLARSDRVKMNITRKVTQFALGRPLVQSDEPILDQIHETAKRGGETYASLITAIAMSDLVQMAQPTESSQ